MFCPSDTLHGIELIDTPGTGSNDPLEFNVLREAIRGADGILVVRERGFFIDNLLVRIHFIIVVNRWTGLAPWKFEFPFSGSRTSTFLVPKPLRPRIKKLLIPETTKGVDSLPAPNSKRCKPSTVNPKP